MIESQLTHNEGDTNPSHKKQQVGLPNILNKNAIRIAPRNYSQVVLDSCKAFKVLFKCCKCGKEVEPDKLDIGRAHVYALHCGMMQDVGIVV